MALARFFFQWVINFAGEGGLSSEGLPEALFATTAVGGLFFAFRIFDGLTDPLAGQISDGWVRKGKKRRSLLWYALPLPAIGLMLVFAPTSAMPPTLRWLLISAGMLFFFVGYTFYAIPYWSLSDDYSQGDDATRTRLSNLLGAGTLLATGGGFVLSPWLVENLGFFWGAVVFAVVGVVLMAMPYFAAPQEESSSQENTASQELDAADSSAAAVEVQSGFASFMQAMSHRRFVAVFILFAGGQMAFTILTAAAPYVAVNLIGGSKSDVALLLGPFLLTSIPAFIFAPSWAKKFGWEKTIVVASILLGVVLASIGLLGQDIIISPLVTGMIVFSCGGPMAATLLGLEAEAIVSCAEERGGECTSMYFGVFNLVVKALNGLALLLTGFLASQIPDLGSGPVRMMGFAAGITVVIGVILYRLLRAPKNELSGAGPV